MTAPEPIELADLETAEQFHARVTAATDDEGRLAVAVEEMPGWEIFPFEIDSLRIKPLQPLLESEPARRGEDPTQCWCASSADPSAEGSGGPPVVWSNERWRLVLLREMRLPIALSLEPLTHHDLPTLPDDLADELGLLLVAAAAAVEELPSVGRVHVAKYGDGGPHLHLFLFGRPARMPQLRGSPLLDWEENLPAVPSEVHARNAAYVVQRLAARRGGTPQIPQTGQGNHSEDGHS